MNQLPDVAAEIARISRIEGDTPGDTRKARAQAVQEVIGSPINVGTRSKPNAAGIALLHRRALFVTGLAQMKVWP